MTDQKPNPRLVKPPVSVLAERAARLETPEAQEFVHQNQDTALPTEATARPGAGLPLAPVTELPWEDPSVSKTHTKQVPFRMLEDERAMLNYFADTTYGENNQSIIISAVREKLARMAQERGMQASQEPKTGKLSIKLKGRR